MEMITPKMTECNEKSISGIKKVTHNKCVISLKISRKNEIEPNKYTKKKKQ